MFDDFSHYLAYGSTDQETLRELTHRYEGMIVPGTIASYQSAGTRGFVLSLSASISKPYAIDPRTPLFQYRNVNPKQSHMALANILGVADLLAAYQMVPLEAWADGGRADAIAQAWLAFNTGYTDLAPSHFQKYARRLKQELPQSRAQGPSHILAPYVMLTRGGGPEIEINEALWSATVRASGSSRLKLRRVFAAQEPDDLARVAADSDEDEVVIWIDDLDEANPDNATRLLRYARLIRTLSESGKRPFALYGGYFAVALRTVGLRGASHGIGFSEHRDHVELRSSGGAPARFYIERIHRYLPVEVARELWRQDPQLVDSGYDGYIPRDPGEYTYHELMKHSVHARSHEIDQVAGSTAQDVVTELNDAHAAFRRDLDMVRLNPGTRKRAEDSIVPLRVWARAMGEL